METMKTHKLHTWPLQLTFPDRGGVWDVPPAGAAQPAPPGRRRQDTRDGGPTAGRQQSKVGAVGTFRRRYLIVYSFVYDNKTVVKDHF